MNASRNLCLRKPYSISPQARWRAGRQAYYAPYRRRPSAVYRPRQLTRRVYFVLTLIAAGTFIFWLTMHNHGSDSARRLRITQAQKEIRKISSALDHYAQDNFTYPSTQQGLEALVARPSDAPFAPNWKRNGYLKKLPLDPWGHPYQYYEPGTHGSAFDLFSLGSDGKLGGRGNNADIGNWNLPN